MKTACDRPLAFYVGSHHPSVSSVSVLALSVLSGCQPQSFEWDSGVYNDKHDEHLSGAFYLEKHYSQHFTYLTHIILLLSPTHHDLRWQVL